MTREEARKAAELMMAYAEGKEIELFDGNKWRKTNDPDFRWGYFGYRIKPEPTYRPFKDKEECWAEMQKHQPFGWVKEINGGCHSLILRVDNEIGFQASFEHYTFADGTPFGIEVKE